MQYATEAHAALTLEEFENQNYLLCTGRIACLVRFE